MKTQRLKVNSIKNKCVIILALSIIMAVMVAGMLGIALADEIKISLIGDGFTNEEKNFVLANLEDKLEGQEMPSLLSVEALYDFNGEPLYGLYEFVDYYVIVIRETGSFLERGEGNSKYFGVDGKKYYGGYGKEYSLTDKGYKALSETANTYATEEEIADMQDKMVELRTLDYQDYLEAISTPMPLGASNRHRYTKLGNDSTKFNYFTNDVNIDYRYVNYNDTFGWADFRNWVLYSYDGTEPKAYGLVYMREFDYGADLFYPKNVYNACSLVCMTMLLQYYDRLNLNTNLIPSSVGGKGYSMSSIKNNPLNSRAERIRALLDDYLRVLQVGNSNFDGAATYVNIGNGFNRYFDAKGIDCKATHFTSYTNVKKAIDQGNPAIVTIGLTGNGWDIYNNSISITTHNLIAYGYTKNSIGVLDEFICHANWHRLDEGSENPVYTAKLFVNKFNIIGNVYISGI